MCTVYMPHITCVQCTSLILHVYCVHSFTGDTVQVYSVQTLYYMLTVYTVQITQVYSVQCTCHTTVVAN